MEHYHRCLKCMLGGTQGRKDSSRHQYELLNVLGIDSAGIPDAVSDDIAPLRFLVIIALHPDRQRGRRLTIIYHDSLSYIVRTKR